MEAGRDELVATLKRLDGRYIPDTSPERMTDYEAMRIHVYHDPRIMERVSRRYDTYGVTQGRKARRTRAAATRTSEQTPIPVTARATETSTPRPRATASPSRSWSAS